MKRNKTQKGITLVALIITIIILLILAVVAIRAVQGDGIIAHAKNVRDNYNQAQISENGIIQNYTDYIIEQLGENKKGPELTDIKIGDKVNYDEGYSANKTNTVDSNFKMEDMDWRVLDIESDGTIKLISTKPTTSKLTLSGEQGWIEAETKLDTLCSDLYANGTGVIARSLKIEDIDKLAGIVNDADKKREFASYGELYRYKYDKSRIYCSKSEDNGKTWSEYVNTEYAEFKEPGKLEINRSNPSSIAELRCNYYYYGIEGRIKEISSDGILISDLITKGVNDKNDGVGSTEEVQWLSNKMILCGETVGEWGVACIQGHQTWTTEVFLWHGSIGARSQVVRPVVCISLEKFGEKIGDTWQVNL